jgi:hypothetical protein
MMAAVFFARKAMTHVLITYEPFFFSFLSLFMQSFSHNEIIITIFNRRAKRCKQWKKLLRTVPIPSFHMCEDCETEFFNCHHQASFDDPRISRLFTDLSPYKRCMKLMPVAQIYVKNLLSFYNLYLNINMNNGTMKTEAISRCLALTMLLPYTLLESKRIS